MNKICLVIIFNHNYERNIPILRKLYANRFSNILFLVPFYRGSDPDVVCVYDNSFQFNGYIAQAFGRLAEMNCDEYFFVGDDVCLNPMLNEENLLDQLKVGDDEGFVLEDKIFTNRDARCWNYGLTVLQNLGTLQVDGSCERKRFLPTIADARRRFEDCGVDWRRGATRSCYDYVRRFLRAGQLAPSLCNLHKSCRWLLRMAPEVGKSEMDILYPAAWGYSDVILIPRDALADFCYYSGIFAAGRMFVEAAIPTAMILACKGGIKTLKDIGWEAETGNVDYVERDRIVERLGGDYQKFLSNFPPNLLFYHPIKLSQWHNFPQ